MTEDISFIKKTVFSHKHFTLIRLLISLIIIGLLMYNLNLSEIYQTATQNPLFLIALISTHYLVSILINAFNINIMLRAMNLKTKFRNILGANILAYSLGQFFLGKFGELSLAYFLKKKNIDYGLSSSVIIIDKLITFISLIAMAGVGFFIFLPRGLAFKFISFLVGILVLSIFLIFSERIRGIIKRIILRKYSRLFVGFSSNLNYLLREKKRYILADFIFTFLRLFICAFIIYLILGTIYSTKVDYILIPVINSMGLLMTLVPVSFSGLGLTEGIVIYFYSQIGISLAVAGAIMFSLRFCYYLYSSLILVFYLNFFRKTLPETANDDHKTLFKSVETDNGDNQKESNLFKLPPNVR